jgi:hypothetical protein
MLTSQYRSKALSKATLSTAKHLSICFRSQCCYSNVHIHTALLSSDTSGRNQFFCTDTLVSLTRAPLKEIGKTTKTAMYPNANEGEVSEASV